MAENRKLNVLFLPYFAPSHITPMVDIARLFAARGVATTIVTTTNNSRLFQDSVNRDTASGHQITVHTFNLPSAEVGLPKGIENFGQCTSREMMSKLSYAISLLQKPTEQFIRETRPDCIISDMFFPWTVDIADELKVPRILLYPSNSFFYSVLHSLRVYAPHEKVQSDFENFTVPGLPDKIQMARSELQDHFKTKTLYGDLLESIRETENRSFGIILTSVYELEHDYFDHLKKIVEGRKYWNLGPLSLFANGGREEKDLDSQKHSSLIWLDAQKPKSVIYVCFGSMVVFSDAQLTEIALALEAAGQPFVWVVRKESKIEEENEGESWLPEGFEERMVADNKGIIIRGWAPQIEILDHPAVGGFLNHCGWNSLVESVIAGTPLLAWPLFAEHFYNAKLVTQVLKIGIEIGPRVWNSNFNITSPLVGKDELEKGIRFLMGGSEEMEEMRPQTEEFGVKVKKAVEEGGSSYRDLTALIEDLKASCLK